MTIDEKKLRLMGVYRQDKEDHFMLRVKIPAGALSATQARTISALSEEHSNGMLHLTCRGSIEFHWLKHECLSQIFQRLQDVGLTTRGACGGAVRGISCSTTFAPGFPAVQAVAQKLNRHFAGNPDFEGLPKKFKVGIDAGYHGARHLIQDLGLVMTGSGDNPASFDVWCAGGLGRAPQAAFLLEEQVCEEDLLHLIEAVVQVYRENTPPPRRLKYLLNQVGEDEFRKLLESEKTRRPRPQEPLLDHDTVQVTAGAVVEVPVFAGELTSARLRVLADIAASLSGKTLAVTNDQNIALFAATPAEQKLLTEQREELHAADGSGVVVKRFRVCPGSHECRMGLAATREVAQQLEVAIPASLQEKSWAISGCPNSCSQPQLADYGIVTSKLQKSDKGDRHPLYALYRRRDDGFGQCIAEDLTAEALYDAVRKLT